MNNQIVAINEQQRDIYEEVDERNSITLLKRYFQLLDLRGFDSHITLLDVGAGGGYFTKAVCDYLRQRRYEVTAYVLDPMRYPSWDHFQEEITFCQESVEHVDTYFKNIKFDLIFCNKVFHHFVTDTYAGTLDMMRTCMKKLRKKLSKNRKLCILDIFYDGLLVDSWPSRVIYHCTSQKNEFLIKVFRKLGAQSAGSGVCFQSEKMWRRMIGQSHFAIDVLEKGPVFPMKRLKQVVFMSHRPIDDCIFICSRDGNRK